MHARHGYQNKIPIYLYNADHHLWATLAIPFITMLLPIDLIGGRMPKPDDRNLALESAYPLEFTSPGVKNDSPAGQQQTGDSSHLRSNSGLAPLGHPAHRRAPHSSFLASQSQRHLAAT